MPLSPGDPEAGFRPKLPVVRDSNYRRGSPGGRRPLAAAVDKWRGDVAINYCLLATCSILASILVVAIDVANMATGPRVGDTVGKWFHAAECQTWRNSSAFVTHSCGAERCAYRIRSLT
jgi:hypothetical protein